MASLGRYFRIRTGTQLLLSSLLREGDIVTLIDKKEQWILEVQAWFVTAFLNARYTLLQIVRREGPKRTKEVPDAMLKLCQIILFANSNYTNVDFIGLLLLILALLLIPAFSHRRKIILASGVFAQAFAKGCTTVIGVLAFYARKSGRRVLPTFILHFLAGQLAQSFPFRRQSHPEFPRSQFWSFWHENWRVRVGREQVSDEIDLESHAA